MSVFWGVLKAVGGLFRGGRAGFNTFASWKTRARVLVKVEDEGVFVTHHGILFRGLAIFITASEKADLVPKKAVIKMRGSKASAIDITTHILLPRVVPANRTEKTFLTGTTLDELLARAGESRKVLEVEVCITDHYDREHQSGWTEVDRADLRREKSF